MTAEEKEDEKEEEQRADQEEEEEAEEEEELEPGMENCRLTADWSRGRCLSCARRGQLHRHCRNCAGRHDTHAEFRGCCHECNGLGCVWEQCRESSCEDGGCAHIPCDPQFPLDPNEPEEFTDDDSDFSNYRREWGLDVDEEDTEDEDDDDDEEDEEEEKNDEEWLPN